MAKDKKWACTLGSGTHLMLVSKGRVREWLSSLPEHLRVRHAKIVDCVAGTVLSSGQWKSQVQE